RLDRGEIVGRVEPVVPHESEPVPVELLRPGLADYADHPAGGEADVRAVAGAENRELLNGIDRGERLDFAGGGIGVVEPVDEEIVVVVLRADDVHAAAAA